MKLQQLYPYTMLGLAFLLGFAIPVSTSMLDIVGVLLVVLGMLSVASRGNLRQAIKQPLVISSLLLYGLFVIGVLWSYAPASDIKHMLIKMDAYLYAPFLFAIFMDKRYQKSVLCGFACAAVLAALLSIISAVSNTHFFNQEGIRYVLNGKMQHVFQGHTYQNYFSGLTCVGLLAMLITQKLSTVTKFMYAACIIICLCDAFFFMPGRTGQILFVVMLIGLFIQWRLKLGIAISVVLLVVVLPLCILLSPTIKAGISMANSDMSQYNKGNVQTSIGARFQFHKYSVAAIKQAPFIGHGTGSFHQEYLKFKPEALTTNPHNDYLWFGVELGMLGILSLIILICATVIQAYRALIPYRYLGMILPLTYAFACVQNSFFTDRITAMAYVVLVSGLLAGTQRVKLINKVNG